jgi:hypothetical protein
MATLFVLWLLHSNPIEQPTILNAYPIREACEEERKDLARQGRIAFCRESVRK